MAVSQNHILGSAGGRFCDLNIAGLKIFACRLAKTAIFSDLIYTYSKTIYKQITHITLLHIFPRTHDNIGIILELLVFE